jgi:ribosomal protein L11 methyltransferase
MLKSPYKKYDFLHIYNVEKCNVNICDNDLIGVWEEEDTLLIFFHKNKDDLIREKNLKLFFYTKIHYNEWESGKFIGKFKIGDFHIVPVWEDNEFSENKIIIDPSVVFGTGFHPTTRMILESFYTLTETERTDSCIDLGCGSGILSVFAAKRGVNKVVAADNNNLSFEVACKNKVLNNVCIEIYKKDIFEFLPYSYNVVFANLYYHLLHKLFEADGFWNAEYYFLSGFIENMEEEIKNRVRDKADIIERKTRDNWVMLLLKRR